MSTLKQEGVEKMAGLPAFSQELKKENNHFNSKAMHYTTRNKAFIKVLSKKAATKSLPIACNTHGSLLHLAYKLRVAEKAMYGNRPNAVAGIIPIPPSAYTKNPVPLKPLKRSHEAISVNNMNNHNAVWPVLIGAKGSEAVEINEELLAKYSVRPGVGLNGDGGEILAQPLSSSEMKNIVDRAISCVIDSKRKKNSIAPPTSSGDIQINCTTGPCFEIIPGAPPAKPGPPPIQVEAGSIHKHKCPMCDYETDNRSHLRRHQSSVHSINVPYFCYICKRDFARVEKVKYHFERVHPEVTYDPKIVRKDNYDEDGSIISLNDDSETEGDQTGLDMTCVDEEDYTPEVSPIKIITPSQIGTTPAQMDRSTNARKGPPQLQSYKCPQCSYLARDVWHLRRHIAECHTTDRRFRCSQCQYATNRRHNMVSHVKLHDQLVCIYSHCDQPCKDWQEFSEHLNKCGEKPDPVQSTNNYNCQLCDSRMPNRSVLAKHLQKQHNITLYCCLYCTFMSTNQNEYYEHTTTHSNASVQCAYCSDIFDNKTILEEHIMTTHSSGTLATPKPANSNQELMTCSICQYTTRHRAIMNSHLRSRHQMPMGAKKCSYPGCSFSTQSPDALVRHYTRCHEQPIMLNAKGIFPCPVCTDRPPFKYRKSFEKHMDTHKKEEKCPLCEEGFYTFDLLKKHIEGDHEAEVEEVSDSEDEGIDTTQDDDEQDDVMIIEQSPDDQAQSSPPSKPTNNTAASVSPTKGAALTGKAAQATPTKEKVISIGQDEQEHGYAASSGN